MLIKDFMKTKRLCVLSGHRAFLKILFKKFSSLIKIYY